VTVTVNVVVDALHAETIELLERELLSLTLKLEVAIFALEVELEEVGLAFELIVVVVDFAEDNGEGGGEESLLELLGVDGIIDFDGETGTEVEAEVDFDVEVGTSLEVDDDFDVDVPATLELEVG
jgi:hypothetical protein